MNIQLEFSLTPDDFREFQIAYQRHRKSLTPPSQRGLRSPQVLLWLGMVLLMIFWWLILSHFDLSSPVPPPGPPVPPMPLSRALIVLLPYVLMFISFYAFLLWIRRSRYFFRRAASQSAHVGEPKTVEITESHLAIHETNCSTNAQWRYYIRFVETKNLMLLFVLPRLAHIFPKRAFPSDAALDEFRQFAQAHISNQPIGFPVEPAHPNQPPPNPSS